MRNLISTRKWVKLTYDTRIKSPIEERAFPVRKLVGDTRLPTEEGCLQV
jgi:hypothetical protein